MSKMFQNSNLEILLFFQKILLIKLTYIVKKND
jgi:hypothetical protein